MQSIFRRTSQQPYHVAWLYMYPFCWWINTKPKSSQVCFLHNIETFQFFKSVIKNTCYGFSWCPWTCSSSLRNCAVRFHKNEHPIAFETLVPLCFGRFWAPFWVEAEFSSRDNSKPNPSDGAWHFYVLVYLLYVPPRVVFFVTFKFCFCKLVDHAIVFFFTQHCDWLRSDFRQFSPCLIFLKRLILIVRHFSFSLASACLLYLQLCIIRLRIEVS